MGSMRNRKHPGRAVFVAAVLTLVAGAAWAVGSGGVIEKEHARRHFNTRVHLSNLDCDQCHLCELPTKEEPCLIECPRHMGHFHSEKRPDDGPEVVVIDQLANLYKPVIFAHKLHATMSDMIGGCENCHHYSEKGGAIQPCRECHDPDKGTADLRKPSLKGAYHRQCLNCHMDWSHENACNFCHEEHSTNTPQAAPDTTDIVGIKHPLIQATDSYYYDTTYEKGPIVTFHHVDHVEQFGLKCVDCHTGDSCSRCHDQARSRDSSINNMVSCTQCHEERGCKFCHDYKRKPKFDHAKSTGWDLGKRHEGLECRKCHGVPKVFHTPNTTCTSCHKGWLEGEFEHTVTGVDLGEDHGDLDCTDCHLEGDFSVPPSCSECHDDGRHYDPKVGFGS